MLSHAQVVLCLRDRFEMIGIAAATNVAKVVDVQTFRDRSFVEAVSDAMYRLVCFAADVEAPVVAARRAHPEPAAAIRLWNDAI